MRTVIVTGASRGIGLAIAGRLSAAYQVIAVARRESEQLSTAMEATRGKSGGGLHFRAFDLADISAIPNFAKSVRREFGPIYGLVNNAAAGTGGLLSGMQNAAIERLVGLNTVSPIVLTKYVVRAMMADGGGRIVNIASIVNATGFSGLSVYAATKASMVGFTRSLARELGPLNINVNAVAPGFVDSEMTQGLAAQQREQIVRRSALRRLAEPGDIAGTVEFLLGESGRNITGTVITVDAGSTA